MDTNFILGEKEHPKNIYLSEYKNRLDGRRVLNPVVNLKDNKEITTVKISNNRYNDFISEKQLK
jgi:hypothetical protein